MFRLNSIKIALLIAALVSSHFVSSQSFFTVVTLKSLKEYGEVSTRHLPPNIVQAIESQSFSFDEWSSFFTVISSKSNSPIKGLYRVSNDQVIFTPENDPDPSDQFMVTFSYPNLNVLMQNSLQEAATFSDIVSFTQPSSNQPEVTAFIPNLKEVPANLLRFYVYFSAPMGADNPYDHITIQDKEGNMLDKPFVIVPEGLWNIDRTRLTLLLHPIQEMGQEDVIGDVLLAGNSYTLKIKTDWKGASGQPLKENFTQTINASNPLRGAMNINIWALSAETNSIGILKVITDHPLDQPLAKRMLFIRNDKGQILPSRVEFDNAEQLKILWKLDGSKSLELLIDPRLEDVCGNTPHYAFDLDGTEKSISNEELKINFRVE